MTGDIVTPDFAVHPWRELASVDAGPESVVVAWDDGTELTCHPLWLFEMTRSIDPVTREGVVDPGELPTIGFLIDAGRGSGGELRLHWADGEESSIHPGWLRSIADGEHLPESVPGDAVVWTARELPEPPSFDGSRVLDDIDVFDAWIAALCSYGLARLRKSPTEPGFLAELAHRVGPIRGSNFGEVFTVEAILEPDSTANTSVALGQHTDLPTRETPPGFQFLHCLENSVAGGASRMTDGLAVVEELERCHPDDFEALTTLEWVFANRAVDGDHRWIGPIVDRGGPRSPLTLRAFYPVRLAPHMDAADVPRAYEAMRTFSRVAHSERFMMRYDFEPGDIVGFDNRRVLHGRDAFDASVGVRRLEGCYLDRDDVLSRLRVLRRPGSRRQTVPTASEAST